MKKWIALFSRSGNEINNIRKILGRDPDLIITNRVNFDGVCDELIKDCSDIICQIPFRPQLDDYLDVIEDCNELFDDCIITLNGFLRIIPAALCEQFDIYNLHPGLINKYPELKGKDPQRRAYEGEYDVSGNVIFKIDAGVDTGSVICYNEVCIKDMSLDETLDVLHDAATSLWINFLKERLK